MKSDTSTRFHTHTLAAFNRASAGVATSMVVLMAFLVGFKDDPKVVEVTLRAIKTLAAALGPFLWVR